MDKPIVLRTFSSLAEAEAAAAQLEADGIEYFIQADDGGGMLPSLQLSEGVKLIVDASAESAAREILRHSNLRSPATPSFAENGKPERQSKPVFWPCLLLGVVLGVGSHALYEKINQVRPRTYEYDNNNDGKPDEILRYDHGALVSMQSDQNFDGYADAWYYYEKNLLLRGEADQNFDRQVDVWMTYSNGVLFAEQQDTDYNGKPDIFYFYKDGVLIRTDLKPNAGGPITLSERWQSGVLREELRDLDGDGQFDRSVKFDAFRNPLETNYFKNLLTKPDP